VGGATVERRYEFPGDNGFDLSGGAPSSCVGSDNYSIKFMRQASFPQSGDYRFTYTADDGIRLYVDGQLIADRWTDPQVITGSVVRNLSAGSHTIQVDYYQATGGAHAALSWTFEGSPPVRPPAPTGLTATGGTDAVFLGWNPSPDASVTSYNVKRRLPPDLDYSPIGCNFTDAVHCTDTNVTPGTSYCYAVTAFSPTGGESDNSSEACATPTAAAQPSIQLSSPTPRDSRWRTGRPSASRPRDGRRLTGSSSPPP
jgi:hypothetical protein